MILFQERIDYKLKLIRFHIFTSNRLLSIEKRYGSILLYFYQDIQVEIQIVRFERASLPSTAFQLLQNDAKVLF